MSKSSAKARAHADIALIKYWGKQDEVLRLPVNDSLAISLEALSTTTKVTFDDSLESDQVVIGGQEFEANSKQATRVIKHLDRIRDLAGEKRHARVESKNSFPSGTGLSSSGSAFAALTMAATKALGLKLSTKQLSFLARQGSGSACRSVTGGIVQWFKGSDSDSSYSKTVFAHDYWDIRDVIAVVSDQTKLVSSTAGHKLAPTSPLFKARLSHVEDRLKQVKKAIMQKDFQALGEAVEQECFEFHAIAMTSRPSLFLWLPGSVAVFLAVRALRDQGVPAYATVNTGHNIQVLTLCEYESKVARALKSTPGVKSIIRSKISAGPEYL